MASQPKWVTLDWLASTGTALQLLVRTALLLLVLGQSTRWTSGWVTMSMGEYLSYVWRSKQT
jgi:hypothetical protein